MDSQIKTKQSLVSLAKLIYLRRNPQYMTPHEMEALKSSIERDGFLAPVLVRPKGNKFEILSGNHRAMAANELGYRKIPVIIAELTDEQAKRVALNLNTIHGDPTAELLAPFLAEFDETLLATIHLDDDMRNEIAKLDENMKDMFAKMEIPDVWNKASVNTETRPCTCPKCGKRHIRDSDSSGASRRVRKGQKTSRSRKSSSVRGQEYSGA
jgi:ParB/RepB/Spo0J family partition protein